MVKSTARSPAGRFPSRSTTEPGTGSAGRNLAAGRGAKTPFRVGFHGVPGPARTMLQILSSACWEMFAKCHVLFGRWATAGQNEVPAV